MELKQFHLHYHYRGVEIEMVCLTGSRFELVALTGVRNSTAKRLAYFDSEEIPECMQNPNVVYVRRLADTRTKIDLPDHPITLESFQALVDGFVS